jgi:hypothetical protein
VRITFCKNLTAELLAPEYPIAWRDNEQRLAGHEPAAITVNLEIPDQNGQSRAMQATCLFPYEALDENAMTLSNPLSAYATMPDQMTLNGQPIAEIKLREANLVVQLARGKREVKQTKQDHDAGADGLQSTIEDGSKP